jgi:two-component system, LytTR family, response regulator
MNHPVELNNRYLHLNIKGRNIKIETEKIIRVEARRSYCQVYAYGNEPIEVHRSLNHLSKLLSSQLFSRVHKSHLVNKLHIKRLPQKQGYPIEMSDKSLIPLSRKCVKEFTNKKMIILI